MNKTLIILALAPSISLVLCVALYGAAITYPELFQPVPYHKVNIYTPNPTEELPPFYFQQHDSYVGSDFVINDLRQANQWGFGWNLCFYQGSINVYDSGEWHTIYSNVTYRQDGNTFIIYPDHLGLP